ncbi:unnamed protein product [Didymodactylos carnosus]|nr:unnamed protein product [Didymodactylos carnosus]CAF4054337.1 unnamed protein product [Didymodactylos carnosus]
MLLADVGEYRKSLDYFKRLLNIQLNDHNRAKVYYNLGRAYRFQADYEQALYYFQQAEILQKQQQEISCFHYARTLAGIGSVYSELHDTDNELKYYNLALEIYKTILSHDHIEIARSLNRIGYVYHQQKQYDQALEYFKEALIISIIQNQGDKENALEYYNQALKIRESILPCDHPQIAQTFYRLSLFYYEQQNYQIALQYSTKTLDIYKRKLSINHCDLKNAQDLFDKVTKELLK